MKTKLIIAALLTTLSLPVHAEVYKCGTVYQQSPCAGQVDTATPMKINLKDTGNGGELSEGAKAMVQSYQHRIDAEKGSVRIGMNKTEVVRSWGQPSKVNRSFVGGHSFDQWVYPNDRLYFQDGILTSWN